MAPKKEKVTLGIKIDPNKHAEKIKEIEESIRLREEQEMASEFIESLESLEGEEEASMEGCEIDSMSEGELGIEVGRIDLSFPETTALYEDDLQCFPPSYYTLSPKERLLLMYTENFRKQFVINNPKRRPLVLAPFNECDVQKLVCTTIRPTGFLYLELIGNEEGLANFVADFITYEPLVEITRIPKTLMSPATLLRRRRGHSFEMATLLCSMLIAGGYPAMVVSGVARIETVLNKQHGVPYPYEIVEIDTEENQEVEKPPGQKYKLRPLPDLESHLKEELAQMLKEREEVLKKEREELEWKKKEELKSKDIDKYHYRRSHAWVMIFDNAPWSVQPKKFYENENGETIIEPPTPRFIEPSTGFYMDIDTLQYVLIDSIWNDTNYYVNMQKYDRIANMRWDLTNTDDWEHLLPGEPPQMRVYDKTSEENLAEPTTHEKCKEEEKHLDITSSWVLKLHIGEKEYEERYPKLKKVVKYYKVIHERFSPYTQKDGLTTRITTYKDENYEKPLVLYEYYENRADYMIQVKFIYENSKREETFLKCRDDSLRFMEFFTTHSKPKFLYFYSQCRLDCLSCMEIYSDHIVLKFSENVDLMYYQEFEVTTVGQVLKKVIEKFYANTSLPPNRDIAVRTFFIHQGKIHLKFHYTIGALTASTIEFLKPPKPDYGKELVFNPAWVKIYKSNQAEADHTPLELYKLLLKQLKYEDKIKKHFEKLQDEISLILDQRKDEIRNPVLKFSLFDRLRNGAARNLKIKEYLENEAFKAEMASKPPDFLAPYLVQFKGRQLTFIESIIVYRTCLSDLKTRFVGLLNDLQRHYDDLTNESKALKRFLNKFEGQFNTYDYNKLTQEAKNIDINKRMIQQRLTLTHEESQKKYENVKNTLLKDPRLTLVRPIEVEEDDATKSTSTTTTSSSAYESTSTLSELYESVRESLKEKVDEDHKSQQISLI